MTELKDLEKDPDFISSYVIVRDVFKDELYDLSEQDFKELTQEIMLTCESVGGDVDEENIRFYAQEYIKNNFYYRFKKIRGQL